MLNTNLISVSNDSKQDNLVILSSKNDFAWTANFLNDNEIQLLKKMAESNSPFAFFYSASRWVIVEFLSDKKEAFQRKEIMRINAGNRISFIRSNKIESLTLLNFADENLAFHYAEGLVLGNYKFIKYFKEPDKQNSNFKTLKIDSKTLDSNQIEELRILMESVFILRNLVNEPQVNMDAVILSEEIVKLGREAGFNTEIFDKDKIEDMGMGGLLAVNKGSKIPPTFSIMEWKPEISKNSKPIILVGKGVVFDTGGLSLKPTPNSMDFMKCDMAGAAVVVATMYMLSKLNLPLHVVGLIPATDNRPGENAYVPGDIIRMMDGSFVEVLNTDAEGRLILADALHYAKKYEPELVLDFATLTGSAAAAIGTQASVVLGNATTDIMNNIKSAGLESYERTVEFPLWEEYLDEIKSDIADLKNLGGPYAGAITAAKFLEYFTNYQWVHFDIAGVAFFQKDTNYRPKGATGYGLRMMYEFLNSYLKDIQKD